MEKKLGYCYPSGLEKTLSKWDVYVPLVTKGLILRPILEHVFTSTDSLSSSLSSDSTHQPVYFLVKIGVVTDTYFYHLL